jgi:hypothetical protein
MRLDIFIFIAFAALTAGLVLLFASWFGGGRGGSGTSAVTPNTPMGGGAYTGTTGWLPGSVRGQVSNWGIGASTPEVMWN